MTSVVPNRSVITGRVLARHEDELTVEVNDSRPAWPKARDLAADYVGGRLSLLLPEESEPVAPGDLVTIECSLEPVAGSSSAVAFVAARVERR